MMHLTIQIAGDNHDILFIIISGDARLQFKNNNNNQCFPPILQNLNIQNMLQVYFNISGIFSVYTFTESESTRQSIWIWL